MLKSGCFSVNPSIPDSLIMRLMQRYISVNDSESQLVLVKYCPQVLCGKNGFVFPGLLWCTSPASLLVCLGLVLDYCEQTVSCLFPLSLDLALFQSQQDGNNLASCCSSAVYLRQLLRSESCPEPAGRLGHMPLRMGTVSLFHAEFFTYLYILLFV